MKMDSKYKKALESFAAGQPAVSQVGSGKGKSVKKLSVPDGVLYCKCGYVEPDYNDIRPAVRACPKCAVMLKYLSIGALEHPTSDADAFFKLGLMMAAMGHQSTSRAGDGPKPAKMADSPARRTARRAMNATAFNAIREGVLQAGDIVLGPAFVSIVGSFANGELPHDLDLLFTPLGNDPEAIIEAVAAEIGATVPEIHVPDGIHPHVNENGPQGNSVPLYDLILRKRPALKLQEFAPGPVPDMHQFDDGEIHVPGSVSNPHEFMIERMPLGARYMAEIMDGEAQLLKADGLHVLHALGKADPVPEKLIKALETIRTPGQCVLDLFHDPGSGRTVAIDMLRRNGCDLCGLPLSTRRDFLESADLGEIEVQQFMIGKKPSRDRKKRLYEITRELGGRLIVRDISDTYSAGNWSEYKMGTETPKAEK